MSRLECPLPIDSAPSPGQGEDLVRLFNLLDTRLGLSRLMPEAQKAAFGTVLRGLRHMAPSSTQAAQWLEVLAPFATRSAGIEIADSGSAALHPILPVLCDQPAVSFPTAVQAECCAIGARVFLAVALELVDIPASFAHGLRQLYRNKQQTWESRMELRW